MVRGMRSLAFVAALALAGCPKGPSGTTTPQPGAGCPAGNGVFVASYVTQDPSKGRSGWVIPLHSTVAPSAGEIADYAPIDAATASAAGVPAAPTGTLWLASASGEPCRATAGRFYMAKVEGDAGQASVAYGVELDGCAAPANAEDGGGIVLASEQAPTGCRFEAPQPAAARLGEMDVQKQWQRPAKESPIPPALASVIPAKDCPAPSCEKLWAFAEVKVNDQTVAWTGAVNWLAIGDPAEQCTWPAERFSGFFVPGPGGAAVKIIDGQTHPLVLSAVLADGGGPRVLLAEGPGEYATYDLVGGNAIHARTVAWMLAPADAWEAVDHIGPICDPQR
jgi:hypothetical protein